MSTSAEQVLQRLSLVGRTLKARSRSGLDGVPAVGELVLISRHRGDRRLVSAQHDLMIEAYPRSGNTFLTATVELYNPELRVAHHMHSVAHVKRGIAQAVPVVIIVREPAAAVASFAIFRPDVPLCQHLRAYIAFHRRVLRLKSKLQLVTFADVTQRTDSVLRSISQRSGLTLAPPAWRDEHAQSVREELDRRALAFDGGKLLESHVARPMEGRNAQSRALQEVLAQRHGRVLAMAQGLFQDLASAAGT